MSLSRTPRAARTWLLLHGTSLVSSKKCASWSVVVVAKKIRATGLGRSIG
jgi:hypothetical protein